jgi:hypothetical protein
MSNSEDFWLLSVPGDKTPQDSWEKLYKATQSIATPFKFNIPNLKVNLFFCLRLNRNLKKKKFSIRSVL